MGSPESARPVRDPSAPADAPTLLALARVLSASDAARVSPAVSAFYAAPTRFHVRATLYAGVWSGLLLRLFALVSGQCRVLLHTRLGHELTLAQRVYRDSSGRIHWDRHAVVGRRRSSLFVAYIEHGPGFMVERFRILGVGLPIRFSVRRDGEALVMESRRFLLGQHVVYRTAPVASGAETQGHLRLRWLGLTARTVFRIRTP